MNLSFKEIIKTISFIILICLIGIMCYILVWQILNLNVDFININPQNQINKSYHLEYPYTGLIPLRERDINNKITNLPLVVVDVYLRYYNTLTEGTPVYVTTVGYIYPDGQNVIGCFDPYCSEPNKRASVVLGFEDSSDYNCLPEISTCSFGGEMITPLNNATSEMISAPQPFMRFPIGNEWPISNIIEWESKGDYSPYIIVNDNGKVKTIRYSDYKISIGGSEIVQQEKYSKINTFLAIALFFFTLITSVGVLEKVCPEKLKLWWERFDKKAGDTKNTSPDYQYPKGNS